MRRSPQEQRRRQPQEPVGAEPQIVRFCRFPKTEKSRHFSISCSLSVLYQSHHRGGRDFGKSQSMVDLGRASKRKKNSISMSGGGGDRGSKPPTRNGRWETAERSHAIQKCLSFEQIWKIAENRAHALSAPHRPICTSVLLFAVIFALAIAWRQRIKSAFDWVSV